MPQPSPVRAYRELLLGFRIVSPESIYGVLRTAASRPLPQSLALTLTAVLGLSPAISGRFAGGQDWFAAVTHEPDGSPSWALAVPVYSGRELVAELSLGRDARHQAVVQHGWTELRGGAPGLLGALTVGVSGNYVLLGSSNTALGALAPWTMHGAPSAQFAPEQGEAGVSGRVFASGAVLQALHAHWSERGAALLTRGLGGAPEAPEQLLFERVYQLAGLLSERTSAFLGAIEGGQFALRLGGRSLDVQAQLQASNVPLTQRDSKLCAEISALPRGVRLWAAGSGRVGDTPGDRGLGPDWEQAPGEWQRALLLGFGALGAAFEERVNLDERAPLREGRWLIAWRDHQGGSTALGILGGVPPVALRRSQTPDTDGSSRVQMTTKDGKVIEWAWTSRGDDVMTAVGAGLGHEWDAWVKQQAGTDLLRPAWPQGLSPSLCHGLIAAIGVGSESAVGVSRHEHGLQVQGSLDYSTLGGFLK